MTVPGQFRSIFLRDQRFTKFAVKISYAIVVAIMSCTSTPNTSAVRTAEEKEEIKNLVQSAKLLECRLGQADWLVPGDVSQVQMMKVDDNWTLIYEALLRSGPRTVYQPLRADFSFNGDGVVMGMKDAPKVTDLKTFEDVQKNRWYLSRFKLAQSELFSGLVEVIANGHHFRSIIPLPDGESVQQMWPSQPIVSGYANVIVRSTSANFGTDDREDESVYRWFQVSLVDNSAKLISSYKSKNDNIQPAGFISLEKNSEPVAVTIVQPKLESAEPDPKLRTDISKVALRRIFNKNVTERVLFSGKGNFAALTVSDPTFSSSNQIAWIYAPQRKGSRYIQSVSLPVKVIPERYFSRGPLREIGNIIATELSYEANNPDFSFVVNNQKQVIPVLSWWGKLENDIVLLVQVITPQLRQNHTKTIRFSDGSVLGIQFQPSLAIIPPKTFSRVMFFTAAPTSTEKSVMVLSNRNDSAEIAMESKLYSCFF